MSVVDKYHSEIAHSLDGIQREDWNQLNPDNHPFLKYDFLHGLEKHGCLSQQAWQPCHHLLYAEKTLIAAIPCYLKQDSYGEFVFDWAWADAYERAGGHYYPKLVSAIPFTPVSGRRLLIHPDVLGKDEVSSQLLTSLKQYSEEQKLSSSHILFCQEQEAQLAEDQEFMTRLNWQYHWFNQDYRTFEDYLAALNSKRRKQIRKERRELEGSQLEIERLSGKQIEERHWQQFYQFYCSTFERKWGEPRFTLPFFLSLMENWSEHCLLVLAKRDGHYIAGAFAVESNDTLYGRHWGCSEFHPHLHFELCYYQTIEYCIDKGLKKFDAGIQGEHKIFRGFEPVKAYSLHWIRDPGFRRAVENFLNQESQQVDAQIDLLNQHIPYTL